MKRRFLLSLSCATASFLAAATAFVNLSPATDFGVVEAAPDVREGVISMPHGFGDAPAPDLDAKLRSIGSNTGRLSSVERDCDPYSGIPRMSAIPVKITRYEGVLAD